MKDKKVLILLFLVIIMLLLGIGYALTDTELIINGEATASASQDNFKVRFKKSTDDATYEQPTAGTNATGTVTKDLEATMNVTGLTTVGDEARLTFAVENYSEGIDASVKAKAEVLTNSEYFSVKTEDITDTAETVIEPGKDNSKTVTVVVTLNKTPIVEQTGTVKVTLTATPKAK